MTLQDLRTDANVMARARGGSVLAWPVGKGKVSEKLIRNNIELFDYFTRSVSMDRDLVLKVPTLVVILGDCARYWKSLPEEAGPFTFHKVKADAKAIKAACLCLSRLRKRADHQRDPEVNQLAESYTQST